ncbi:molybdate ABC transporter substrate-binding protein [Holophaga foetida]|uniref:molybdate ABC transporter substrate-binding protein n=1 Tax=Holophaga foetida TaxID=35839 RepID=UPI0002473EFD|nr:molybdate ABC transporter substrate-binding protein [Holophaga foetida]
MKSIRTLFAVLALSVASFVQAGDKITVAAAASLKNALTEVSEAFKKAHPGNEVALAFTSSGKALSQIQQGAPYDIFLSADMEFPEQLVKTGFAASEVKTYALGHLVLWSSSIDAKHLSLEGLTDPKVQRIAIANPKLAPYGKRAEETLKAKGLWSKVESKLVYGESISQTAQFALTGNAQVGFVALSLALSPEMAKGSYIPVPENLHQPLAQGYVILKPGANRPLAKQFGDFLLSRPAQAIFSRHGFSSPRK